VNQAVEKFISLGERGSQETRQQKLVQLGEGLIPMPWKLMNRIQDGEFGEFSDFPGVNGGAL